MLKNPVTVAIGLILLIAMGLAASLLHRSDPVTLAPEPAATGAERVLRFGHNIPVDSALHQAAIRFAESVAQRSAGRVRVEVFPAQELGTDDQMLEMARRGELDILLIPTAKISASVPAMQYADLPFYFPSRNDLYDMLDGEPGRMLLGKLREIDLVGVTFWENGFKHFTANRPLHRPEDFGGLDMRTMKSRLLMEQFRALGAHSIPIDFHATRQALADKVVSGQENPLVAIVNMGLHEVQSHLTLSSHGYLGYVFMISAKVFDELLPDVQDLLLGTARELTPWEREETHRREEALLETIRQAGVTIHELTDAEREQFVAHTEHIPALFEDAIGADVMARTEELLDHKYGAGEHLVIGLDADLSQDCRRAGLGFKRGAALAIEEINAAGGVLGKSLQLIARDHKGMPSVGVSNMKHFAARPDVVAVLGGVQANVVVAQADVVRELGLPFLVAWSAAAEVMADGPNHDPVFRVSANDVLAVPFLTEYVVGQGQRPAILFENSVWGRGNLEAMRVRLQRAGLDFVAMETFSRGEVNFGLQLARIERSSADTLVLVSSPMEGGLIVRALAERSAAPRLVSHWGNSCGDFWGDNREALAKLDLSFFQTFSFIDNSRPVSRALAERYRIRHGLDSVRAIAVPQAVAQAYDLVHLLALGIARAGSTERGAVREALEHLPPFDGAVRRYAPAFTPERHDALDLNDYRMARYAEDGAIVGVKP